MADAQQQDDECLALESIFGPEVFQRLSSTTLKFGIPGLQASPALHLNISLPTDYPSMSPPVIELHSEVVDESTTTNMAMELESMFTPGEVILFTWVSWLQDQWERVAPPLSAPPDILQPAPDSATNPSESDTDAKHSDKTQQMDQLPVPEIIHGEPLTEKKSTFQAHVALVKEVAEVQAVVDCLLTNNKIRAASHNIMAYRIERGDAPGVFYQDADDDGETAAGARLLHLLQILDAKNVVVVVSRWFGGTLLGPLRFGLINKVAAELLESCGVLGERVGAKNKGGKGQHCSKK